MATEMAEVSNRVNFGSWVGRLTCPEKSGQREYPMISGLVRKKRYGIQCPENIGPASTCIFRARTKKGSRNKKHYEKLPDGLHADDDLKEQWGKIIQARIDQNFSMSMGAQCMRDNPSKPRAEDHRSPQRKRGWKTYWGGGESKYKFPLADPWNIGRGVSSSVRRGPLVGKKLGIKNLSHPQTPATCQPWPSGRTGGLLLGHWRGWLGLRVAAKQKN